MRYKKVILLLLLPLILSACSLPELIPEVTSTPTSTQEALQIFERTYADESDDPRYELQLLWPNLMGEGWQTESFNSVIDTMILKDVDNFLSVMVENKVENGDQAGEPPLSTFTVNYELTANESGVASVQAIITQYIALSVHPFTTSHAMNYDARAGEFLNLADLFNPEADYLLLILNTVDEALQPRDFGYEAGAAADVMAERENRNLEQEGLRINFDTYEVGPYAAGPQSVIIPWEDLAKVLNLQGPAGIFYP